MSGMSGAISIRVDAARRSSTGGGYPPAVDSPQSDMQARRSRPDPTREHDVVRGQDALP